MLTEEMGFVPTVCLHSKTLILNMFQRFISCIFEIYLKYPFEMHIFTST